jgi:hypothetical protein
LTIASKFGENSQFKHKNAYYIYKVTNYIIHRFIIYAHAKGIIIVQNAENAFSQEYFQKTIDKGLFGWYTNKAVACGGDFIGKVFRADSRSEPQQDGTK